jgi:hypothetical protein
MNTTLAKLIILNTCWVALVVWASFMGYTQFVFDGDGSYASYLIAAILAASVAAAFSGRSAHLSQAAWLCETLGFVGTLVGITIGLSGVGDLSSEAAVVAAGNSLFSGVATAFCSTITGAVAMLWLWSIGRVTGASSHA